MRVLALTSALRPRTRKPLIADTPKYKTTRSDRARRGHQSTTPEITDTTHQQTPLAAEPSQSINTDDLDTTTPYNQSGINPPVTANPTDDTLLPEINQTKTIDPIPELNADKFDPNQHNSTLRRKAPTQTLTRKAKIHRRHQSNEAYRQRKMTNVTPPSLPTAQPILTTESRSAYASKVTKAMRR